MVIGHFFKCACQHRERERERVGGWGLGDGGSSWANSPLAGTLEWLSHDSDRFHDRLLSILKLINTYNGKIKIKKNIYFDENPKMNMKNFTTPILLF